MTDKSFYFNPVGQGLEVFLGPTEAALMEILWKHPPLTVKKTLYYWPNENRPAYTTVMTVLTRLHEKGLLHRKKEGRNYVYSPTMTKKQFIQRRLRLISECLKKNFKFNLGDT